MKAFFDKDIRPQILDAINNAQKSIYCAVYRFNDETIYKALDEAISRGVILWIIINDDEDNLDLSDIIERGGNVYKIDGTSKTMHNKFIVTDRKNLITGSYNWTNGAMRNNYENVIVVQNAELCGDYLDQFEYIKKDIDDNVKQLISEVLNIQETWIKAIGNYTNYMMDYIQKYKQLPPKEIMSEFQKATHESTGSELIILNNTYTTPKSLVPVLDTKKKIDYKSWWDKLDLYWKFYFNDHVLDRGVTDAVPSNWEAIFSVTSININNREYNYYNRQHKLNNFNGFSEIQSLVALHLQKIPTANFSYLKDVLPNLKQLTCLNCEVINLEGIILLEHLEYLDCRNNPLIDSLEGLNKMRKLRTVYCDEKFFSKLPKQKALMEEAGFKLIQKNERLLNSYVSFYFSRNQ